MPAVEARLSRFEAAHTQVLGVSVDSFHSHANWASAMGGISFPLLSDFEPKGDVGKAYGVYLKGAGITDRATVIIDRNGIVRHVSSVGPDGERNIDELLALCEDVDRQTGGAEDFPRPEGLPSAPLTLYVKNGCWFCRRTLLARENLHLQEGISVRNVAEDESARDDLVQIAGSAQVPCLLIGNEPMHGSDVIVRWLAERVKPLPDSRP